MILGELFRKPKMLSEDTLSSCVGGIQCSAKLIVSKVFNYAHRCKFSYRVRQSMTAPEAKTSPRESN